MDNVIEEFFEQRRAEKIKKDIKSTMSEEEANAEIAKIDQRFALQNWIPDAAARAGQLSMSTHPSKFSHPSAGKTKGLKTTPVLSHPKQQIDGLLRSGNVEIDVDALGNAAALDTYKFLTLVLDDGRSLIEHLETDSQVAKQLLDIDGFHYADLKASFLQMKNQGSDEIVTSPKLKQVYFPMMNSEYHLLSLLSPSGLLYKMTDIVNSIRFSEQAKQARENKKKNRYDETGYDDILNTTMIGYGGTKPQNISVFNNSHGGKSYLLNSQPPELKTQRVRLPVQDFFTNSLWPKNYETSFQSLHSLLVADINNVHIRDRRDAIFDYLFEKVVEKVFQIREEAAGWSDREHYKRLPLFQRIILDSKWNDDREGHVETVDKFVEESVRWILKSYKKVVGKDALTLGDDVFVFLTRQLNVHREVLI